MSTIRPMLQAFIKDPGNIPLIINVNVNSTGQYLFREELDPHTGDAYINHWLKSRQDYTGLVSELSTKEEAIFYVVGSDDFMKDTIRLLNQKGVLNENIILDRKEEKLRDVFTD